MRTTRVRSWIPIVAAVALCCFWAPAVGAQTVLDQLRVGVAGWTGVLAPIASYLLTTLFVIEGWITYIESQAAGVGAERLAGVLLRKALVVGAVTALFWSPDLVLNPFLDAFRGVGGTLSGTRYDPALVLEQGSSLDLAMQDALAVSWKEMLGAANVGVGPLGFTTFLGNMALIATLYGSQMVASLVVVLVGDVVIQLAFGIAAAQLMLVEAELLLIAGSGIFFAGFGSFRITAGMTDAYLKYLLQVAVKLFFIHVMVALGMRMAESVWLPAIRGSVYTVTLPPLGSFGVLRMSALTSVLGSIAIYAYFTWKIPSTFAQKLTGEVSVGISAALRQKAG